MKKKIIITISIIILIIQAIIPIKTNAFVDTYEIDSSPAKKENQKADNSIFSDNITFKWSYFEGKDNIMPYGLYSPNNADNFEELPLIVWLHGNFGRTTSEDELHYQGGLPADINNWSLQNFRAYVLCPHLTNNRNGNWFGTWYDGNAVQKLKDVIDKTIADYNIDSSNVIIAGHSMGGIGVLYMVKMLPGYFSKAVVLSGRYTGGDLSQIKIPTVCYVGASEDSDYIRDFNNYFIPAFGDENCFELDAGHNSLTSLAFAEDDGSHLRNWTAMDDLT